MASVLVAGVSARSTSLHLKRSGNSRPRTPDSWVFHCEVQRLHFGSDCPLNADSVSEPVLIAFDFIVRLHGSRAIETSNNCPLQPPTFRGLPESAVVPAIQQHVLSQDCKLQIATQHVSFRLCKGCEERSWRDTYFVGECALELPSRCEDGILGQKTGP